ncbi:MAG TPA: carbohydrate-binding family 9-like protein [Pyrinomonadaceae bacterium]|nr:carbohydrate-binding family 9-like protein [Pyrinomonadaceae bacterium]
MGSDTTIVARFVERPISESDFENQIWRECQAIQIKHYWSGEPAPASRHAEARICWSDEALHVRFLGAQQEPLVVSADPVIDRKTLGLWDRDVCEIFLAPDPENSWRYFEFEAAPTGEWVDLGITLTPTERETDWDFASGFTTAAKVENDQLFVGMRIPWSEALPKPQSQEVWGVNLFRCVGPEAPDRYLAWRPTRTPEPNFHVAEAFGSLRFAS